MYRVCSMQSAHTQTKQCAVSTGCDTPRCITDNPTAVATVQYSAGSTHTVQAYMDVPKIRNLLVTFESDTARI